MSYSLDLFDFLDLVALFPISQESAVLYFTALKLNQHFKSIKFITKRKESQLELKSFSQNLNNWMNWLIYHFSPSNNTRFIGTEGKPV